MAPIRPESVDAKRLLALPLKTNSSVISSVSSDEGDLKSPKDEGPSLKLFALGKKKRYWELKQEQFEDLHSSGATTTKSRHCDVFTASLPLGNDATTELKEYFGAVEHEDENKEKSGSLKPECSIYGEDVYREMNQPSHVEIIDSLQSSPCCMEIDQHVPSQETCQDEEYQTTLFKGEDCINEESQGPFESCLEDVKQEVKVDSEELESSMTPVANQNCKQKKKKTKKKRKIKMQKTSASTDLEVILDNKKLGRCHPSSYSPSNNGSNYVDSSTTNVHFSHVNRNGQTNNPGGGGGDGGGDEDKSNLFTSSATCSKQKKKQKKRGKSSASDENDMEVSTESEEKPVQMIQDEEAMDVSPSSGLNVIGFLKQVSNADLQHAARCREKTCQKNPSCNKMKNLFSHSASCQRCFVCDKLHSFVESYHSCVCKIPYCPVPFCKEQMRQVGPCHDFQTNPLDLSPDCGPHLVARGPPGGTVHKGGQLARPLGTVQNYGIPGACGGPTHPLGTVQNYGTPGACGGPTHPLGIVQNCGFPVTPCAYGGLVSPLGTVQNYLSEGTYKFKDNEVLTGDSFSESIDYQVLPEQIGKGATGIVKRIITKDGRKGIVVKQTKPKNAVSKGECTIMQVLKNDPYFVNHYGVTSRGPQGGDNIFMEECEGDLKTFIDKHHGGSVNPDGAKFFLHQVLCGVQKMHSLQFNGKPCPIVHKDLKALNFMVCEGGTRIKIGDLDAALLLLKEITEPGLCPQGTKMFAAPEVLKKQPHGPPADIHSIGIFILEITVGVPDENETVAQKIVKLHYLDEDLAILAEECTCEDPAQRPTATDVLNNSMFDMYRRGSA